MNTAERSSKAEEGQKVDRYSRAQGNMGDLVWQRHTEPERPAWMCLWMLAWDKS